MIVNDNLVSIITPAYNAGGLISETIESVIAQSYHAWEMIIVDDCSNDNTCEIIMKYQKLDKRIKMISLSQNAGVANARNVGIKNAVGRYVAFLDSDDIWLEKKLEIQVAYMKENDIAFSFGQYRHFSGEDKCGKLVTVPAVVTYQKLLKYNTIGCLTVMIDREKIPDLFMPAQKHEDYLTWLSVLKKNYKAFGIRHDIARYRVSPASLSGNKIKSGYWHWLVLRRNEKLPIHLAMYYLVWYLFRASLKHYW